jgi:hypothetical protein
MKTHQKCNLLSSSSQQRLMSRSPSPTKNTTAAAREKNKQSRYLILIHRQVKPKINRTTRARMPVKFKISRVTIGKTHVQVVLVQDHYISGTFWELSPFQRAQTCEDWSLGTGVLKKLGITRPERSEILDEVHKRVYEKKT